MFFVVVFVAVFIFVVVLVLIVIFLWVLAFCVLVTVIVLGHMFVAVVVLVIVLAIVDAFVCVVIAGMMIPIMRVEVAEEENKEKMDEVVQWRVSRPGRNGSSATSISIVCGSQPRYSTCRSQASIGKAWSGSL
jgi:hypothetical protein